MLRITIAQLNFLTGDILGNADKIIAAIHSAKTAQANVIVFPELALSGYPPEDLLLRNDFHQTINKALEKIVAQSADIHIILGYPHKNNDTIYNAAAIIHDQKIIAHYFKQDLPNYGVFDEKRYFSPGNQPCVIEIENIKLGIVICEDLWQAEPIEQTKQAGAQLIVSLNASPFDYIKAEQRHEMMRQRQKETGLPILYVNLVGGQDELIFDGGSFALTKAGKFATFAKFFAEQLLTVEVDAVKDFVVQSIQPFPERDALIYQALVFSVKDYISKNGFKGAMLGLSGGIDSALTLAIAVDALGAENVQAVMMPSRYTSEISLIDAEQQAKTLAVKYSSISIERPFSIFLDLLKDEFEGYKPDSTEENIQARCRGVLLMAISNKTGKLLLTTGNKSEMSVGYATLYGDMAGGFAVLKDVPKILVYQLAKYRNTIAPIIPKRVIERPPSAELAPDQRDENSLPPYSILDAILQRYVEQDQSVSDIVLAGFKRETVESVIKMVKRNEHKRRQAAPGPRITPRAYGRDRRYPITSRF